MILMNGNTEARVRSSEGCTVLPCGCAHTDVKWLQMCDEHHAPYADRHEAARIAHLATLAQPIAA